MIYFMYINSKVEN